jgi:hypothetical protein
MELFIEVEPSPLACCPQAKFKRKVRARSSDGVLQLLEEFNLFMGLSCDGFEGRLSSLFIDIIANNEGQGAGSRSKVGKKCEKLMVCSAPSTTTLAMAMFLVVGTRGGFKEVLHESQVDFLEC